MSRLKNDITYTTYKWKEGGNKPTDKHNYIYAITKYDLEGRSLNSLAIGDKYFRKGDKTVDFYLADTLPPHFDNWPSLLYAIEHKTVFQIDDDHILRYELLKETIRDSISIFNGPS